MESEIHFDFGINHAHARLTEPGIITVAPESKSRVLGYAPIMAKNERFHDLGLPVTEVTIREGLYFFRLDLACIPDCTPIEILEAFKGAILYLTRENHHY